MKIDQYGIAFICDGLACEGGCPEGTDCMHTTDIRHAVNFEKVGNQDGFDMYLESDDIWVKMTTNRERRDHEETPHPETVQD